MKITRKQVAFKDILGRDIELNIDRYKCIDDYNGNDITNRIGLGWVYDRIEEYLNPNQYITRQDNINEYNNYKDEIEENRYLTIAGIHPAYICTVNGDECEEWDINYDIKVGITKVVENE